MTTKLGRTIGLGLLAATLNITALPATAAGADAVPLSTPQGIMLVDVMQFITNSSAQYLWRRLGDAEGNPLYTYNTDAPGKSNCVAECAKEFPPFVAPASATASGDWTFVKRDGQTRQWAYQGKPLYRYSGKDPVGEPVASGGNSGDTDDPANTNPGSKVYSPKEGWTRAAYTPEKTLQLPSGIELKSLMTSNGYGFITADTSMPMYVVKSAPTDPAAWLPVYAPLVAAPVGDFTLLTREDGKRQWAYKGERLYTFKADYSQSDVNGTLAQKDARIALAYRHFMPQSVGIDIFPLRGPLMTTTDGRTVYTQTRYHLQYGGREMREGYRYTYLDAKGVGVRGCLDECVKTWRPIEAPKDAQSAGFWEVQTRPDGNKQWTYRGSLLYTFAGDSKPGEIKGNNRHDILFGDAQGKVDLSATGGDKDPRYSEGAGFYWHVAGLYN
ncbi:MAG TPA: hypothetical protein VGN07_03260 [Steroidobacteraceae bacterium]|jgi:predicted lipoprotein with Yx(FWY)xxD motif